MGFGLLWNGELGSGRETFRALFSYVPNLDEYVKKPAYFSTLSVLN